MFCAMATVIERCKTEGVVDVFQVVKALRVQKPGAVPNVVSVLMNKGSSTIESSIILHYLIIRDDREKFLLISLLLLHRRTIRPYLMWH